MATQPAQTTSLLAARENVIAVAGELRHQMSQVLVEIAKGNLSLEKALIAEKNLAHGNLYVVKVLESFSQIGKVRAREVLDENQIAHKCKVANLQDETKKVLASAFEKDFKKKS